MSNPDHGHNLEDALIHARYTPDESFAADLHARLRDQITVSAADPSPSSISEGLRPTRPALDVEELPMPARFRWIAAFSLVLLALMVFLFVRLVLVRPTGFAVPGTPEDQVTTIGALFGGEITLASYDVAHVGRTWDITLYWVPEAQPSVDYQISITGQSGSEVLVQQDEPLRGADLTSSVSTAFDLPTTRWQPRRLLTTHHTLTIPDDQPIPGAVLAGLYDPATGIHPNVSINGSFLLPPQVLIWGDPGQPTAAAVAPGPAPTVTPAPEPDYTTCSPEQPCLAPDGAHWIHAVKEGDTLISIALAYTTTVPCLIQANGLPGDVPAASPLTPGQVLLVCFRETIAENQPETISGFSSLSISADGSWIAVETRASAEQFPAIYLIDASTRESTFVAYGAWPTLTADGRDTVFVIQPRGGDPLSWNRENLINLYNHEGNVYWDISSSVTGLDSSTMPAVSADGNIIAFMGRYGVVEGVPSNPVNGDVVVYDRRTGTAERIAYEAYGQEPYFTSSPSISADGRYVAFFSRSTAEGSTQPSGVFVHDRDTGETRPVAQGFVPQISPDGSVVAYLTGEVVNGQGAGWINAAAVYLPTGETRWLGRVLDQQPDGLWIDRVFSLSGFAEQIAFTSVLADPRDPALPPPPLAEGLGSAYLNQFLFVYVWASGTLTRIDSPDLGGPGDGRSSSPAMSADGKRLAYLWHSVDGANFGIHLRDWDAATTRCIPVSPGYCP
jgi:Tol biopolymer transport system component